MKYDVVIVGGGAAGSVLARTIADFIIPNNTLIKGGTMK